MKAQLARTYGKRVVLKARANEGGCVDPRVSAGLLFQTDPSLLLPGGGERARRKPAFMFFGRSCMKHVVGTSRRWWHRISQSRSALF